MTTETAKGRPPRRFPTIEALRETLLYRATPEDLAALVRLGDMMNLYLIEYHAEGLTMRDALLAVAKDVRHLEGYLKEIAYRKPPDGMKGRSGKTLTVVARDLARKLGEIAESFEEEMGKPAPQKRIRIDPAER
jgi:hypothetical protein